MSHLSISSRDHPGLAHAIRTLASPFEYEGETDWRVAAGRAVRDLLGADMVGFLLPNPGSPFVVGEGVPPSVWREYPTRVASLDRRLGTWKRQLALGAWNRRLLWAGHFRELYASEYFNDYIAPNRAFDAVGITVSLPGRRRISSILLHHASRRGPRFGDRGLALLRLLYPAFEAGVGASVRLQSIRDERFRLVDTVAEPLLIVRRGGAIVHANPSAVALMGAPEWTGIERRAFESAAFVFQAADGRPRSADTASTAKEIAGRASADISTPAGRYRVRGVLAGGGTEAEALAFVFITPVPSRPPTSDEVRHRFGLTRQEARTALLLARRSSNKEIARELGISPHTARHHTENVFRKLGIHSRADVLDQLIAEASATDE